MNHADMPTTVRAALLALIAFLAAWQAGDFQITPHAIGGAALAALMGWLNPAKPADKELGE